jgi:hypothetical protein
MPYASDSDLTTRIPATLTASSTQRGLALADAEALIDDVVFGDITVRAQCLLAAHFLALDPSSGMVGGEGGIVSSRSAGEIAVSYAVPTIPEGWDPSFASTTYGRQFLGIASRVGHSMIAVSA